MKAVSKSGLLLAVALSVSAVMAASAQAVISPNNTAVSGAATSPTLTYGSVTITCPTGTAAGTTGTGASSIALALTFNGTCKVGLLSATVACSGTITLTTVSPSSNTSGTVKLDSGFTCVITVPSVCTITVSGPQSPTDLLTLNEAATTLTATVGTLTATRTGAASCGDASRTDAKFSASYTVTPTTLAIS